MMKCYAISRRWHFLRLWHPLVKLFDVWLRSGSAYERIAFWGRGPEAQVHQ
jgi:hypothetical protein